MWNKPLLRSTDQSPKKKKTSQKIHRCKYRCERHKIWIEERMI